MKLHFSLFFAFILTCCGLESCKMISFKNNDREEVHLSPADSGKSIPMVIGTRFEITLNECVGCAETWQISEMDQEKIGFISNSYSGRSCKNCNGGSQNNSFHFKVLRPGRSTIVLHYFSETISLTIEGYQSLE